MFRVILVIQPLQERFSTHIQLSKYVCSSVNTANVLCWKNSKTYVHMQICSWLFYILNVMLKNWHLFYDEIANILKQQIAFCWNS